MKPIQCEVTPYIAALPVPKLPQIRT
jgi:hypothetical protein